MLWCLYKFASGPGVQIHCTRAWCQRRQELLSLVLQFELYDSWRMCLILKLFSIETHSYQIFFCECFLYYATLGFFKMLALWLLIMETTLLNKTSSHNNPFNQCSYGNSTKVGQQHSSSCDETHIPSLLEGNQPTVMHHGGEEWCVVSSECVPLLLIWPREPRLGHCPFCPQWQKWDRWLRVDLIIDPTTTGQPFWLWVRYYKHWASSPPRSSQPLTDVFPKNNDDFPRTYMK